MSDPKVELLEQNFGESFVVRAEIERSSFLSKLFVSVFERAAHLIAEQYVAKFGPEIFAAMDQQAVATLAVANSGAEIAKELKKEAATQTRIVEQVRREVYQRGVFGGLRRL